jgi:hypothetical protein
VRGADAQSWCYHRAGMTHAQFASMALALDGAVEGSHMGHPDFRAHGRIFATIHAGMTTAMVKLTPDQQRDFVAASPAFTPESGAWGRQGCTRVELAAAGAELVGEALTLAWQNGTAAAAAVARRPSKKRQR